MAVGRCAGCGFTDSVRKVAVHIVDCPRYRDLFTTQPHRCLDPEAEHHRYQAEDDTEEARTARRQERLSARVAQAEQHQTLHTRRWRRPPDILDD